MRKSDYEQDRSSTNAGGTANLSQRLSQHPRRRRWHAVVVALLFLVLLACVGRAMLPGMVRDYVNRTLDRNTLYSGNIGDIQIHLWRGAYSIHDIKLSKTTGDVPVPLFAAKRVDFALQWNALIHGRVVGQVLMDEPEINFVDAPTEGDSQTGAGGPWLEMIQDLLPFSINSAVLHNGSIHFRTYKAQTPVDVYLSGVEASIDNLRNISDEASPLAATVQVKALAMDQAKLEFLMTLDPFSYRPTFHLALRLLGLDVTKINDLALTYGKFDFKRGWFDLLIETDCKEGQMTGYVKPLFRNLKMFSPAKDIKEDGVLQFFWQALVGATTGVLKNQARDQFGTLVPFTGDASGTTTMDILATLGNIFRNAFVRAYLPHLESGQDAVDGLHFQAPEFTEAMATGDETR
jgi:hypothetical protein